MARYYKRRNYKRKAYGTRKPNYTVVGSATYLAKRALQGVKYIKSMINCEKKYRDTTFTGSVDWNGSILCLSLCGAGDDVNNRQGNSILCRSLYDRMDIQANANAVNTYFRIIIFQDKENTGTDPTPADVLQTVGSNLAPTSPLNVDHISRYSILCDKSMVMDAQQGITKMFSKYINMQTHLKFTGINATDIYKGALYMLLISNQNTTNLPAYQLSNRMGFYDN